MAELSESVGKLRSGNEGLQQNLLTISKSHITLAYVILHLRISHILVNNIHAII